MHIAKESVHNRVIIGSDDLIRLDQFAIIEPSMTMEKMAVCFFGKVRP